MICPWRGSLENQYWAYTQLFRNGAIEAVDTYRYSKDNNLLPTSAIEEDLEQVLPKYLALLEQEGITQPLYIFMSILDAEGYEYPCDDWDDYPGLDRDVANFPEVIVEEYPEDGEEITSNLMDYVMNSLGVTTQSSNS